MRREAVEPRRIEMPLAAPFWTSFAIEARLRETTKPVDILDRQEGAE